MRDRHFDKTWCVNVSILIFSFSQESLTHSSFSPNSASRVSCFCFKEPSLKSCSLRGLIGIPGTHLSFSHLYLGKDSIDDVCLSCLAAWFPWEVDSVVPSSFYSVEQSLFTTSLQHYLINIRLPSTLFLASYPHRVFYCFCCVPLSLLIIISMKRR
jgi:hypothetical protein